MHYSSPVRSLKSDREPIGALPLPNRFQPKLNSFIVGLIARPSSVCPDAKDVKSWRSGALKGLLPEALKSESLGWVAEAPILTGVRSANIWNDVHDFARAGVDDYDVVAPQEIVQRAISSCHHNT